MVKGVSLPNKRVKEREELQEGHPRTPYTQRRARESKNPEYGSDR